MTRPPAALLCIVGLALAASVASATNGFALDDVHIIATNPSVHSLTRWWDLFTQSYWPPEKSGELYRPFTMLSFASQWALGSGSPLVFHLTSVVLYALVCSAFLWVALALVPLSTAWLAAALFAVHPLHVEVVGNVVGQSELWAALFMLVALGVFVRARIRGFLPPRDIAAIVAAYALGLLSKEHVIVLPLVLIAAELTVAPRNRPLRMRVVELRPLFLMCAAVAVAFLWARSGVLAQSRGIPPEVSPLFSGQPFGVRALTMLRVVLEWTRLLLWPASLSADYSPRHIGLATAPTFDMVVSVGIIALVLVIAWKARRSAPVVTFAVLWLATSMLIPSNLIVVTAFVVAERTLFMASAPVMLGVALAATRFMAARPVASDAARKVIFAAIAIVLAVGIVASAKRQRVWRDNASLFPQMVRDAPTSYQARHLYAILLFEQGKRAEGFEQLRIARELFPKDVVVLHYSGQQRAEAGQCHVATSIFDSVLAREPRHARARLGLASCLIMMGDYTRARAVIRKGLGVGEPENALRQLLSINDSVETAALRQSGGARRQALQD